jgi:hypothetical protein
VVRFSYFAKEWAEDRQTSPLTLMATDHRVLNVEPLGDGGPGVEVEGERLVRK